MAKLKKADFHIEITDQMKQDTVELSKKLRNDQAVNLLFTKNDLPDKLLDEKPWTIDAWRKAYEPCLGCRGLTSCHQKLRGYYPDLKYDGVLQNVMTPCRYKREEQVQLKHLENYRINDLPNDLYTVSFRSIQLEDETEKYLQIVNLLMDASRENKGIFLWGNMGTGKTYLSACAANDHARNGETVSFVHYPSFVQRMAGSFANGEYKAELNRAMYCDFLVLDDIGAESVTEWNRDGILLPLLNHRYEASSTTWFTSNCDFEALSVHFSFSKNNEDDLKAERIMERIEHMSIAQALTGKDRRKNYENNFH